MSCAPPPDCAGSSEPRCAPPPWCTPAADGKFDCKPPEGAVSAQSRGAGAPCPPAAADGPPQPCAPPPMGPRPDCMPGPDGSVRCAPPPECGGAAFGGAGGAGCAPPDFCKAGADGLYDCKPPEDCRVGPNGVSRCGPAPVGAACQKQLEGEAASGAFVPCAPAPTQFCPPPPPGQKPTCGAPPAPPRFCGPGEAQFPPNHPTGAPPVCNQPPKIENGQYRSPAVVLGNGCAPPPPGEWPPAQPAPEGTVWCPPAGFVPAPPPGEGFDAWRDFTKDKMPERLGNHVFDQARRWDGVNQSNLVDITKAAAVNKLFAPPSFDGRTMNGSFASAQMQGDMRVRDFSVGGTPFFNDIRPNFQGNASFSAAAGTAVVQANDQAVFESHNVPSGLMAYRGVGDPFQVQFDANLSPPGADGKQHAIEVIEAKGEGRARGLAVIPQGDWKGIIVGNVRANGSGIQADVNSDSPVFFMAIPPTGLEADTRLDIAHGVADGRVFAEVSILARNETVAQDLTFYDDREGFALDVKNVSQDAVELEISGKGDAQAIVFTVDRETLTTPLANMNVTIDGQTMTECASFDEMTASAKAGGCFHLVANETTVRVSVMPEHFSTHTLVIGSIAPPPAEPVTIEDAPVEPDATSEEDARADAPETTTGTSDTTTDDTAAATPTPETTPTPAAETPAVGAWGIIAAVGAVALLAGRRTRRGK